MWPLGSLTVHQPQVHLEPPHRSLGPPKDLEILFKDFQNLPSYITNFSNRPPEPRWIPWNLLTDPLALVKDPLHLLTVLLSFFQYTWNFHKDLCSLFQDFHNLKDQWKLSVISWSTSWTSSQILFCHCLKNLNLFRDLHSFFSTPRDPQQGLYNLPKHSRVLLKYPWNLLNDLKNPIK